MALNDLWAKKLDDTRCFLVRAGILRVHARGNVNRTLWLSRRSLFLGSRFALQKATTEG